MAPLTKYHLAGIFSVCFLLAATQATDPSTTLHTTPEGSAYKSSASKSLTPLYSMTNGFLRVVFPSGVRVDTISKVVSKIQEGPDKIQPWPFTKLILDGYHGFATCVVVGFLLLIAIPVIGCCCCCCRLCGKCGGKTARYDSKYSRFKKMTCSGLLFSFTVITIGEMVMVFFSSTKLYTIVEDGTMARELSTSLRQFGQAAARTIDDNIVGNAENALEKMTTTVESTLSQASTSVTTNFLDMVDIDEPITSLATVLDCVNNTLGEIIEAMTTFEVRRSVMLSYLNSTSQLIDSIPLSAPLISSIAMYINAIDDLSIQNNIDALKGGVKRTLNGLPDLHQVNIEANQTVATTVEQNLRIYFKAEVQDMVDKASSSASQLRKLAQKAKVSLREAEEILDLAEHPIVMKYASYWWYGSLGFGAIIALVTLLYLVGLMCGCRDRPGTGASKCCRTGYGANFLLTAIGFTFTFYTMMMLFTTMMFTVGSLASSQGCWTIQQPNTTASALMEADIRITEDLTAGAFVNGYSECLNGKSLGDVVDKLNIGYNRQQLMNLIEKQLKGSNFERAIDNVNIAIGNLSIMPAGLESAVRDLTEFNDFISTDFPRLDVYLDGFKFSLNRFIEAMKYAGIDISSMEADPIGSTWVDEMTEAADIVMRGVRKMDDNVPLLKTASETALNAIILSDEKVKKNGSALVKETLKTFADKLTSDLSEQASTGIDGILSTKCDVLAERLKDTANVLCETVLEPFNGLWFSLGWSLIMLIPSFIVAFYVAGLSRVPDITAAWP